MSPIYEASKTPYTENQFPYVSPGLSARVGARNLLLACQMKEKKSDESNHTNFVLIEQQKQKLWLIFYCGPLFSHFYEVNNYEVNQECLFGEGSL